ncbi:peptidyl-prolyl cis-trans isomerase Fpr2p [Trichomonascus vanleenenianus]|uniref:peptidylprolyl isomerase family protein FPR2 n=1 Tax=Trichomonascus vanleenenianus TaxID=2268995 RepID=UPI003ECA9FC8
MKFSLIALLAALFVALVVAAEDLPKLKIGITKKVPAEKCTRKARSGDNVAVHYVGTLEDGTEFDNSYTRGQPIEFPLGIGRVIQGWDQGILGMCVGEKRKLTIPPHLGYGSSGAGNAIPPDATLVFKTELVSINGVGAEGEAKDDL